MRRPPTGRARGMARAQVRRRWPRETPCGGAVRARPFAYLAICEWRRREKLPRKPGMARERPTLQTLLSTLTRCGRASAWRARIADGSPVQRDGRDGQVGRERAPFAEEPQLPNAAPV